MKLWRSALWLLAALFIYSLASFVAVAVLAVALGVVWNFRLRPRGSPLHLSGASLLVNRLAAISVGILAAGATSLLPLLIYHFVLNAFDVGGWPVWTGRRINLAILSAGFLLAALPTWAWLSRATPHLPSGAPLGALFATQLAAGLLTFVVTQAWPPLAEFRIGRILVWQPTLWLLGGSAIALWIRSWSTILRDASFTVRGFLKGGFWSAQLALIGLPIALFYVQIEAHALGLQELRNASGFTLVLLIPTVIAWITHFWIIRRAVSDISSPWLTATIFILLAGALPTSLLLTTTLLFSGVWVGASFILTTPMVMLSCLLIVALAVVLRNLAPAIERRIRWRSLRQLGLVND